ncbi:HAD domain-containing protein [Noviherbaspirillum aridicola]|uniref:FCP1 homology domain-containing protein n=1 Tax=Noviherbaspirillum aridicola TaxID=2849687 RepID=A0ABQ4Q5B1_9BURK|nr:HAD domain-containing protein [Noviherbaspirillum aridicola]GIZ51919.1 hypothetical protein NCCP691_19330 [Noviherbaspirillum aridicola]
MGAATYHRGLLGRGDGMTQLRSAEKVLYLDFDGVLHDDEVYFKRGRGIYIKTPGRSLFEWMPILDELLAPHPDLAIVLSTSWVRVMSFNRAKMHLSPSLQERVIGATFHSRWMRNTEFAALPRGVQVAQDVRQRRPAKWFALDDEEADWPAWCRDKLIVTKPSMGLSDATVQEAIRAILLSM